MSGRVDRASAAGTVGLGFIAGPVQTKDYKNWHSHLLCLTFSIERNSVKPPTYGVDRWAGGSLIRRPKDFFVVSGQDKLGNEM